MSDRPRPLSDDDLRAAYRHGNERPDPAACPPDERIWDAVHGDLGPREVKEIVGHLADCPACSEAWRLAREVGGRTVAREAEWAASAAGHEAASGAGPWAWVAAAAGLLLVVGLVAVDWSGPPTPPKPPDQGTVPPVYRGGGEEIRAMTPDGAVLPRDAVALSWEPVEGALSYEVEVTAEDLTPVYRAPATEVTGLTVPRDRLEALADGARLFWQVRVQLAGGGVSESPVWSVQLGPTRQESSAPDGG